MRAQKWKKGEVDKMIIIDDLKERENLENKENILLKVNINRKLDGKYEAFVQVREVSDGLTSFVFIEKENEGKYFVRDVKTVGTNTFYVEPGEGEESTTVYARDYDSYEQALEDIMKVLTEVEEKRKKVREAKKQYQKWVII
jgi:hypothetical protein